MPVSQQQFQVVGAEQRKARPKKKSCGTVRTVEERKVLPQTRAVMRRLT